MRRITTFVILSGASALFACASQAPAPATPTGSSQATGRATAIAAPQEQNSSAFAGYRRVVVNGQERFCQLGDVVGSRIKQEICLTRAQVETSQTDAQALLQKIQQGNSECPAPPTVVGGDPMGGLNCLK